MCLLLIVFLVFLLPAASVGAQEGTGIFEGKSESRFPSGGEVVTVKFEDMRYDHGQGHVTGNQYRVLVRDANTGLNSQLPLPDIITKKTNLEITITVNKFDAEYFGIWFTDAKANSATLFVPLNGGKVMVRHWYSRDWDNTSPWKTDFFESGHEVQAIHLPAKVQYVYEALEQQCTVIINDIEVAAYNFASFKNRLPWNIPCIEPGIRSGEKTPARAEFDAEFTIRAW